MRSAIGFAGPEFWLADASGGYVRVSLPSDGCGLPRSDTLAAVQAGISRLELVEETFTAAPAPPELVALLAAAAS